MTGAVAKDITELLGESSIVAESETFAFLSHYRGGIGQAQVIARPRTVDEVRSVARYCFRHDVPLVVQGANTGLVGASAPDATGDQLLLNLDRLNRVRRFSPQDRLVVAEAGVRLSALNAHCGSAELFCPIDLGSDPAMGGMAATNTGGARHIRYGGMREQILGLEYVLLDESATLGGRVNGLRKNNCGPSIDQLLIGSGGELAIITAVALTLHRRPHRRVCALIELETEAIAPQLLVSIESALGDSLTACEGMSRNAILAGLAHGPRLSLPFDRDNVPVYALVVEASSNDSEPEFENRITERLADSLEGWFGRGVLNVSIGNGDAFWALRHRISDGLKDGGRVIAHDISMPRSRLPKFHDTMRAKLAAEWHFIDICDFGHIADGGDHYNLVWPHGAGPAGDPAPVIHAIRELVYDTVVNEFEGSFSAEHGVGPSNLPAFQRLVPASQQRLLAELKHTLDPKGLLGHGVFTSHSR